MLMQILAMLTPVFCLIALGALYARRAKPNAEWANRMNMDVFLPALIFSALSMRRFDPLIDVWLLLGTAAIILGSVLLAWPIARLLQLNLRSFLPPMMFSNCGNMGLPLALFAFGQGFLPDAVLVFVTTNLLFFTLGAWLMAKRSDWRSLVFSPTLIATLLGLLVGANGLALPVLLSQTLKLLGDISLPLMLFTLGVRMADVKFTDWRAGALGAVLCPLVGLVAAALVLPILPLTGEQQAVLLLFAVLPPAAVNYLLAEKYQQEPQKVAAIVLSGHVASTVFVPLGLALALR